jgi:hypothetical protein
MPKVTEEQPVFAYTLTPSIALDVTIATLSFGYGVYIVLWTGGLPYSWFMSGLGVGDAYLRLWNRPIRQARFYPDHFEITGRGVRLSSEYDSIKDLDRYRQLLGDFRTDSRVSFTVEDYPNFIIPNRRNRKLKLDLYSFLSGKAER